MKIAIVGYTGSGKSTTARMLGEKYNIPVLHLDTVHWMPDWQVRPVEESKEIVREFMEQNNSWIIDGNYKALLQSDRLESADKILFFDFNRYTCFWRRMKRWLKYRGKSRPDIAEGCNEKIDSEFIRWILKDGRTLKKRKGYENMCKKHSNKVAIIKNQRQLDEFMASL
ncbi:MAG: DNA topology modulation protein [Oscillospiraceae bacterium]|nr:DNA topology modulation protein [Oscillospiraceae bacterium]